jgi:hypothetical protein
LLGTYNTEERKGKRIDSMFEELEVDDIAQQLCIHNSEIFRNIHPIEFLQEIWKKKDDESSPSFKFFVERFDKESYWVATELIHCKDPKKRVLALKKFIFLVKVIPINSEMFGTEQFLFYLLIDCRTEFDSSSATEEDLGSTT